MKHLLIRCSLGHLVAQLNGTLYIYGGQTKDEAGQTTDTWSKSLSFQQKSYIHVFLSFSLYPLLPYH